MYFFQFATKHDALQRAAKRSAGWWIVHVYFQATGCASRCMCTCVNRPEKKIPLNHRFYVLNCRTVNALRSSRSSIMRPPRRRQRFIYDTSREIILFISFIGAGFKSF